MIFDDVEDDPETIPLEPEMINYFGAHDLRINV